MKKQDLSHFPISRIKQAPENESIYDNFGVANADDRQLIESIKELYGKITKETPKKITSKIGIISIGGIDATKKLISGILLQLKYNYNFRYETTPYYLFETSTEDSDCNSHNKFIKMLETESVKFNPKIFIKTDFVGKISAN